MESAYKDPSVSNKPYYEFSHKKVLYSGNCSLDIENPAMYKFPLYPTILFYLIFYVNVDKKLDNSSISLSTGGGTGATGGRGIPGIGCDLSNSTNLIIGFV